jgi:hypothetical protein
MPVCNCPTLTFPNGGEHVLSRTLTIHWHEPEQHHPSNAPTWYEIMFTDRYNDPDGARWVQVASVPASAGSFTWSIPYHIKSSQCRMGIRCRDHMGVRSDLSISADNFTIAERTIATPSVLSPTSGTRYRDYVTIILDYNGPASQRSFYQIYYSSKALKTDWIAVAENVPIRSEPIVWDVRSLTPSTDYELKISLVDDDGNSSEAVFISNLIIMPMNYFIIDTQPPRGYVATKSSSEYTNNPSAVLDLSAFDDATGIKSVTLQQRESGSITVTGTEQSMSGTKTWYLSGDDGVKQIEAIFKDYGNNVMSGDEDTRYFRTLIGDDNNVITAFMVITVGTDIQVWTAFSDIPNSLFKNQSQLTTSLQEITSLGYYDGFVYVATKTSENKGVLNRINNSTITAVYSFTEFESFVTSMAVLDSILYIGMGNGWLYQFNGVTVSSVHQFSRAIGGMSSDSNALYIYLDNTAEPTIYDGSTFTTTSVLNGYKQVKY